MLGEISQNPLSICLSFRHFRPLIFPMKLHFSHFSMWNFSFQRLFMVVSSLLSMILGFYTTQWSILIMRVESVLGFWSSFHCNSIISLDNFLIFLCFSVILSRTFLDPISCNAKNRLYVGFEILGIVLLRKIKHLWPEHIQISLNTLRIQTIHRD